MFYSETIGYYIDTDTNTDTDTDTDEAMLKLYSTTISLPEHCALDNYAGN
jgi:hypothetical protein